MEDGERKRKKKEKKTKEAKPPPASAAADAHFKPSSDVKGIRFGGQFIVKSFTVRRATPMELLGLLSVAPSPSPSRSQISFPFPSAAAYIPTNFTVLAHRAWHTLTLGLGTRNSKVVIFVFETEGMRAAVDRIWPPAIPLGEVGKKLVRGMSGCEMARFKFRKGCLTFYLYAVRRAGAAGFDRADDLRAVVEAVAALNDFLDHTAMLALPSRRSIAAAAAQQAPRPSVAMAAHAY